MNTTPFSPTFVSFYRITDAIHLGVSRTICISTVEEGYITPEHTIGEDTLTRSGDAMINNSSVGIYGTYLGQSVKVLGNVLNSGH